MNKFDFLEEKKIWLINSFVFMESIESVDNYLLESMQVRHDTEDDERIETNQ